MLKLSASLLATAMIFLAPMSAEAARTFQVGLGDPLEGEMGAFALRFKDIVEERSKGEIKIDLFPSSQLGDETEMLQNVAAGNLDMTVIGIGNAVPFVNKLGVMTLPYLFENMETVVKGTTGEAMEIINSYATKEGNFRIIGWVYNDYRYISNSKKPITKIEDIKDMKFRVPMNTVFIESYKSWGANPVPISWAETFTSLQQGVVDGQCIGYISFLAVKFNEANQKYISKVHYTYHLQPLIIGEDLFASLDPKTRELLLDAAKDAQTYSLMFEYENGQKAQDDLKAMGIEISELTDEPKWIQAAQEKVWPSMLDFVGGKDLVNNYLKAIGKDALK